MPQHNEHLLIQKLLSHAEPVWFNLLSIYGLPPTTTRDQVDTTFLSRDLPGIGVVLADARVVAAIAPNFLTTDVTVGWIKSSSYLYGGFCHFAPTDQYRFLRGFRYLILLDSDGTWRTVAKYEDEDAEFDVVNEDMVHGFPSMSELLVNLALISNP